MSKEDYLKLAAKFVLHKLLNGQSIETGSADACNLIELCYEGLGHHDDYPQVPLDEIVKYVQAQMPSDEQVEKWNKWLEEGGPIPNDDS